jgi:2-succinyl-5-enolpyruvyl-6-hydroxy-3-cyclohexene-1-carboxylate synthase
VIERVGRRKPDPAWSAGWEAAEAAAQSALTAVLEGGPSHGGGSGTLTESALAESALAECALTESGLAESALARRLYRSLPSEAAMVVSSSMPVRDVEAFAPPRSSPPRVWANRGANGIDGVVSTSLGVALGGSRPTVALVGDLAFLHDCSALVRAPGVDVPCTVVVADNGGGGIFSFLPPASALDVSTFEDLFGTPQASDVAAVAGGFGLPVADVGDVDAAVSAVGRSIASGGMSVVRVRLPGRDANVEGHRQVNRLVVAAVDAALGALG